MDIKFTFLKCTKKAENSRKVRNIMLFVVLCYDNNILLELPINITATISSTTQVYVVFNPSNDGRPLNTTAIIILRLRSLYIYTSSFDEVPLNIYQQSH